MDVGEKLIFGRYTREECGLPPTNNRGDSTRLRFLVHGVLLLAALIAVGWAAGKMTAGWREVWVSSLPAQVRAAEPAEVSDLLARGRMYAVALPHRPRLRRDLALAAMTAAERSPRRLGLYGNARNLFDGMDASSFGSAAEEFGSELTAAGLYAELGDFAKAFACLERGDIALDGIGDESVQATFRLHLVNAQAYFLAVAPEAQGGDARRSLELAQLMISSRDRLLGGGYASDSAACMDTMASALHANGETEKALATQKYALGLAASDELYDLLRNYDKFAGNAALTR